MSLVRIPVDYIEFDENGSVVRVKRKGEEIFRLNLPMRIRTIAKEEVKTSSMSINVTPDRLGTIPPTFQLGSDAKLVTEKLKS